MSDVLDTDSNLTLVQETWLNSSDETMLVNNSRGNEYKCKRMDRSTRQGQAGGGTLLLYREDVEVIKEVRVNKDMGLYQLVVNLNKGNPGTVSSKLERPTSIG